VAVPHKDHYYLLARSIHRGYIVPFLGAGVNLCDRPADQEFKRGEWLPSGDELAKNLAVEFRYPFGDRADLLRIAQYVTLTIGGPALYDFLHELFDANYQPTTVHRFLASLPAVNRQEQGMIHQLIVTTNYDDALERAFSEAGKPYDLVYYIADGDEENLGKFLHVPPDGRAVVIEKPNEYDKVDLDQRAVIVKVHGMMNRADRDRDSYVITEDHYIDYLTRTDITNLLPVNVVSKLNDRRTQFLFLGYSLRDWNLRVILHRIWGTRAFRNRSWAIHRESDAIETEWWAKRGVQIFHLPLGEYIHELKRAVEETLEAGSAA